MRPLLKILLVLFSLVSFFPCVPATSAEIEEWTGFGDDAYEFLLGMIPPAHRGDWIAFESMGRDYVVTATRVEGVGAEQRLTVVIEEHDDDGKVIDRREREIIPSQTAREMVDGHDRFVVSPNAATVKDKAAKGALVKTFISGEMKKEFIISPDVPFGGMRQFADGGDAVLVDFGWGDGYRTEDARLTFRQAADRVADALPASLEGEWCEYVSSGWDAGIIEKYHVTQGKSGIEGGERLVSIYGVDGNGWPHSFNRDTITATQSEYGEGFFDKPPYYAVSPECVSVKYSSPNTLFERAATSKE